MKKMKNKLFIASGFTIAELLISLLISALLAAAMVPVLGMKKVKFPSNKLNHGLAICYYTYDGDSDVVNMDEDGKDGDDSNYTLHYYYASSTRKETRINSTIEGDHCTFRAPNSPFIQVYAIGAGGHSAWWEKDSGIDQYATLDTADILSGTFTPDENFQSQIDAADNVQSYGVIQSLSGKIREAMNRWSKDYPDQVIAAYNLKSPIGRGGIGRCKPVSIYKELYGKNTEPYKQCEEYCSEGYDNKSCTHLHTPSGVRWHNINEVRPYVTDGERACWAFIHGEGQRSGFGGEMKGVTAAVNGTSNITIYNDFTRAGYSITSANLDSESVYLTASKDGAAPTEKASGFETKEPKPDMNAGCVDVGSSAIYDACEALFRIYDTMYASGSLGGKEREIDFGCEDEYINASSEKSLGNVQVLNHFKWEYTPSTIRYQHAVSGIPGEMRSKVFENLTGELYLYPAKHSEAMESVANPSPSITIDEDGNVVYGPPPELHVHKYGGDLTRVLLREHVEPEDEDQEPVPDVILMTSRTGKTAVQSNIEYQSTNGGDYAVSVDISRPDLPLIKPYYDDAVTDNRAIFGDYISKVNNSKFADNPLSGCDQDCPGFAGDGSYIYLTNIPPYADMLKLYNVFQHNTIPYTLPGDMYEPLKPPASCIGNFQLVKSSANPDLYLCKPNRPRGNPGAVIIVW